MSGKSILDATRDVPEPSSSLFSIPGLKNNVAQTMEECLRHLELAGQRTFYNDTVIDGSRWCNATWDTVLCWPATRANSSINLACPPLKGLDPTKNITKFCHASGRWMGKSEEDFGRDHGWTNFTMCYTEEVLAIMRDLNNGSLMIAQDVARNARKIEFVGLGLSLFALIISIFIFTYFRRLRVFRNNLHRNLFISVLMVVIIRLVLYIDLIFTDKLGPGHNPAEGKTINTMVVVCEAMYFMLEYFKTVAFAWSFLEGFYLHHQLVFAFSTEPKIAPYLLVGYGLPLIHTAIWLTVVLFKKDFKMERCLGSYYLEPEFWILDGPRLLLLLINGGFLCNVMRVLWTKVTESASGADRSRTMKSVKAAFMLIPLLGIPNIMQTIPFSPTKENITYFAMWTYIASITYMYQGFFIAVIFCFTNRDVLNVVKACYGRYRLQHTSQNELRRGSRSIATHYHAKNGQTVTTSFENNNASLSPYQGRHKKGSDDSTSKLMVAAPPNGDDYNNTSNNNGFMKQSPPSHLTPPTSDYALESASERTPLKYSVHDDRYCNGKRVQWDEGPLAEMAFVDGTPEP